MESFYPCPLILNRCGILNQDFLSRKENREVPETKEISSTSISLLRGPRWEKTDFREIYHYLHKKETQDLVTSFK